MSKSSKFSEHRRSPGRPREFDIDAAVDAALLLFRERGFHASSIADLSSTMELTAGSIYKAFNDKRAIFLAAFNRYTTLRHASLQQLLEVEQTGLDKVRAVLTFYAESSHGIEGRRGCLIVGSATELTTFDSEVARYVTTALQYVETSLRNLIRIGQSDGSISSKIDADDCARVLLCLLQGFRVIGKTGRTRAEMTGAVDQAMRLLI